MARTWKDRLDIARGIIADARANAHDDLRAGVTEALADMRDVVDAARREAGEHLADMRADLSAARAEVRHTRGQLSPSLTDEIDRTLDALRRAASRGPRT